MFLLGDAAHLTPPFIGQGLCAGLRDAANLTRKLTAVLDGRAREALLDSYEQERAPHARALIVKARTVGWAMTGGQDAAAHVRRVDLAVACRLPGATDRVLDADPPRFGDGQAVRRAGRRDQVTGGLLPQPRVVGSGREVLLDRALGAGHVVLVAGSPDDALVSAARAAGIPVVTVTPPAAPGGSDVVDAAGHLLEWFRRSRTGAVLVRPDHLVQARAPRTRGATQGAALAAHLRSWCCDLAWCPPGQRISR